MFFLRRSAKTRRAKLGAVLDRLTDTWWPPGGRSCRRHIEGERSTGAFPIQPPNRLTPSRSLDGFPPGPYSLGSSTPNGDDAQALR